ncbi:hypothetical protein PLESTB_000900700 [Pleodorina starrii]|uniref:Uncharacterized protein n=1 Tax=Pleodorina starrii TaxID=330485 RepID=A0A9W6F3V7_9CHLO|nr:hypothetical protein PLESTB_000900700 [Pleodorina starrii]
MYGRRNPVLRHFGADELATQGTLQSIDERRTRGEFVGPAETIIGRPTPEFDDYFEFDRPIPSGLAPRARDLLVEDASSPLQGRRTGAGPHSHGSASPGAYSPVPPSPAPSPPLGSYNSSPSVGYQAGGADSGGSGSGAGSPQYPYAPSAENSQHQHPYGGYAYGRRSGGGNDSGSSPARSSVDRGTTPPRRSYDQGPTIQQPPFRSGVPVSGPVRRPGTAEAAAGGRRRTASSSREASRSPSPSPQPSSDPATSEHRPSASDITSPGGDGAAAAAAGAAATPRRGLGAKISGRPAGSALTPPSPRGGGAGVRPGRSASTGVSPSPRGPSGSRATGGTWGAAGRTSGTAGAGRRAPAWAPASGIANMRLEDEDEATRVALMLNDPGVRRDAMPPLPSPRGAREGATADQQQQQQSEGAPPLSPRPSPSPGPPQPSEGFSLSPGYGSRTNRASDVSEQFYDQYRLRKHREQQGVPDFRFSQPRSQGAHVPLSQRYFSFDEAHPALAEQHYIRSPAQERALQTERRKLQEEKMRATRAEARSRLTSPRPVPSAGQLAADVDRLARVRDAGRSRLRELEREGETLRHQTRQVQQRALDAIARSNLMTATASRSASPGPSPSPRPLRSRSRSPPGYYSASASPSGFYSHRDLGGSFGPSGGSSYLGPSPAPSHSPGRFRPASASASPSSVYHRPASPGGGSVGAASYHDSPPMQQQSYVGGGGGYYSGGGGGGGVQQRPLSAPPASQGGFGAHGSDEAREVLEMINSVERLPQHEQTPIGDARGGRRGNGNGSGGDADADFLQRARSVASSRADMGLLGPDEQRIAMGAYDRSRYEEYQRQVDLEMQRRAVEDGYNSDLERDQAADLLVQDSEKVAEEEEARRRAEEAEREQRDAWMDEYRKRLGPQDGYLPQRSHSARDVVGGASSAPHSPAGQRSVLSDAEQGLLGEHFVPLVSPELTLSPGGGYASEGPDGDHPHRRTRRRLFFKSTVTEPFHFEEREKARPKTIAKVKLEQDLALRRAEEEAARKQRFRARPLPPAVVEPRYERMMLEAEAKRQLTHHQRLEELASMMEQPFSFYYRDQERREEREALARAAKDPNRFQATFRAREVPQGTKEERFRVMMIEIEARREATRRRVEDARQAAKERAAQEAAQRREAADRAYRERLRPVDPALHPHPSKPLGALPDFNSLHRQFEVHMARTRANIRKRVTVPQEFTLNGSTLEEQAARARKAQERRQRIILDMQLDSELLPETRWPHKSPRGKVRRTPPPPYLVEWMSQPPATRAASAKRTSTAVAAAGGAYQTRAEREEVERRASEKLRKEALRRADRLLKAAQARRQQEAAAAAGAGGGGGGGGGEFGLASDVAATAAGGADPSSDVSAVGRGAAQRRRAAVSGRHDNPEVYVEARHAQVEKHVRVVVEEALLDQGIEAYRYVEGIGGDKKKHGGGRGGGARAGA